MIIHSITTYVCKSEPRLTSEYCFAYSQLLLYTRLPRFDLPPSYNNNNNNINIHNSNNNENRRQYPESFPIFRIPYSQKSDWNPTIPISGVVTLPFTMADEGTPEPTEGLPSSSQNIPII
jgi:hypothetical protein